MPAHLRQPSNVTAANAARFSAKEINGVKPAQRQALGEVTITAVNRKDTGSKLNTGKEKEEVNLKRGRSDSTTLAQRVPLGPGRGQVAPPVAHAVNARVPLTRVRVPAVTNKRVSRLAAPPVVVQEVNEARRSDAQIAMDVEDDIAAAAREEEADASILQGEEEVEAMFGVEDSDEDEDTAHLPPPAKMQRVWPEVSTDRRLRYKREVEAVHDMFEDRIDVLDPSMVSEYAEEIFEYMNDLEEEMMPNPDYMDGQTEITWAMRQTLVDWLLQVHLRYHMLPETLWIAVNIVDRFLTKRVVSLVKLQLVGVTAMFVAAKYEEILAPSVEEFVFMTEEVYPRDEILKGERIMLQTLEFRISHYCSPYSWMRKISKADDYDIHTRTLSKFLTEVTLLDHRFLRVKPSLVAAVGMYCSRKMLGGGWGVWQHALASWHSDPNMDHVTYSLLSQDEAFVFYSDYTEEQLLPGHNMLVEKLTEPNFSRQYVCKKYAHKKFLKASVFAIDWARSQVVGAAAVAEGMSTTMSLSFKGHTVVITGAGGGLGKTCVSASPGLLPNRTANAINRYSLMFASRGANVVVNDFNGAAAQKVVDEIVQAGGKAVVNTSSVADGAAVIKSALDAFGGVTILINNAGILRDKGFKNMSDKEWDQITEVHLKGAFTCTKAAWPHFRKQKFGRVINTASAAGLYGNFGQANYSAAKMALIGFTKTLAREGAKYGIKSTAIAPIAASPMTETIMPPEMLANLSPEYVAPFVAALCHPDGPDASGKVFELGAGFIAEIRWERSNGTVFKTDSSFTPSAVKAKWSEITDFSNPYYPVDVTDVDSRGKLEQAAKLPPNTQSSPEVRFDGQTVIITGAGAGLGRAYAHMYGKLGANVVVNDVSEKGANAVVDEVVKAGGKAAAAVCSAEDGEAIVKVALEKFGGVHVLIANAGILRDKSFTAMTEQEWDIVLAVHLRGTYKACCSMWHDILISRLLIVNADPALPIRISDGNFGQANYSTAKAGITGLTRTLAIEGKKYNILANVIAPSAGTAMTSTIWPQEMVDAFKPDFIAPIVGYLSSADNTETSGSLFEILGGWAAQTRWQRAGGHGFPTNRPFTPEEVVANWHVMTNFDDGRATHPSSTSEALQQLMDNFGNKGDNARPKL
ncbi:hypothetical protein D9615_009555 [Tricholomella constricta]|uniref:Cyclin N-terminal domain-containing protein n=1 Tax=Tricholomella constricta TaxID=117010 RepID=A0A8H5GVI5_9AGAR|nr:hypothetical protein D9615_009555 [Tricholomella constricta]